MMARGLIVAHWFTLHGTLVDIILFLIWSYYIITATTLFIIIYLLQYDVDNHVFLNNNIYLLSCSVLQDASVL